MSTNITVIISGQHNNDAVVVAATTKEIQQLPVQLFTLLIHTKRYTKEN